MFMERNLNILFYGNADHIGLNKIKLRDLTKIFLHEIHF